MICDASLNRCQFLSRRSSFASLLVPRKAQAHANGVNQIVAYQSGSERQRKLRAGRSDQPMMIASTVATRVSGVPPAVHNTCCDRKYNDECEPAGRRVEQSFGTAFPTSQRQAEQSENGSNAHSNQGEPKR